MKIDLRSRLSDGLIMFIVTALSLGLLIYVGIGEAKRTMRQIHIEKLAAQGRVIESSLESFLRAGLPMPQYVGFRQLTQPLVDSDETIDAIVAFDAAGRPVFTSADQTKEIPGPALSGLSGLNPASDKFEVLTADDYDQVVLPLRNRFERIGSLMVLSPHSIVSMRVQDAFKPIFIVALGLSVLFAVLVATVGPRVARYRFPWLQVVFALFFITTATHVVGTLMSMYSNGIQAKTKALADSLGQRLSDLITFNIDIKEIDGLDRTFIDYRQLNPEISAAGLMIDGIAQIHTTASAVGKPWVSAADSLEYTVDVSRPDSLRKTVIAVAVPMDLVYRQVMRSAKNFAALFVASAFLAGLFLQFAGSVSNLKARAIDTLSIRSREFSDYALSVVKPVFFVTVFLEHLNYSFLPQFMLQHAREAGISNGFASMPFMIYYLTFAVTLIPAGYLCRQFGARGVVCVGLMLASAGVFGLMFPNSFAMICGTRALAGVGQAMVFIGIQSYILVMAAPDKRTQANGIIVFGFQGGMISGMAIGSLLVSYVDPQGVFLIAGSIALVMLAYTLLIVPPGGETHAEGASEETLVSILVRLRSDLFAVAMSRGFLRTILLIGIPAKAVLTGVIIFALPLILTQAHYVQEDIGQIVMLYAAGVVIASHYVSRVVDRGGRTKSVLFWGASLSALGLLVIGFSGIDGAAIATLGAYGSTIALLVGVILVGFAHGFINAPVVTHISDSDLATKIGTQSAAATYRFLERLGHIAGPIIVGQLFFLGGTTAIVVAWVGWVVLSLGFLFMFPETPAASADEIGHRGRA